MHMKPSENEVENYINDADVMVKIAWCKIKGLMAEKLDRIYEEDTQE